MVKLNLHEWVESKWLSDKTTEANTERNDASPLTAVPVSREKVPR